MAALEEFLIDGVRNTDQEQVKTALKAGADVHAKSDWPLRWAAFKGHVGIVETLLEAGANVNARNDYALRWATSRGHTEVVQILLRAKKERRP